MSKDTISGIIGALVLVAAMTGVFFYERSQSDEYTVTWAPGGENTTTLRADPLSHASSRSHGPFTLDTPDALLARVFVEATWRENTGDEFRIDITAPDGTIHTQRQSGGRVGLAIKVQDPPDDAAYADEDADGAINQAWSGVNGYRLRAGQGDWMVQVTLVHAMRPNEVAVLDDDPGENRYTLTFSNRTWVPAVHAAYQEG